MSEHDNLHSRFGGSSASRWLNCIGSTALIATVPAAPDSKYAREGTLAHALAEHCLRNGIWEADDFAGKGRHPWWEDEAEVVIPNDMVKAVNVYLDAVATELGADPAAQMYVEARFTFDLTNAAEGEVFGANDCLIYQPMTKRLVVFDYKHGVGVSVSADDNEQLKFYAAGAALSHPEWQIAEVVLVVVQPRAFDAAEKGEVRPWAMDVLDLIEFPGQINEAIDKAKVEEGAFKFAKAGAWGNPMDALSLSTGKWCRWCAAAAVCPAKERQALVAAVGDYEGVSLPDVTPALLPDPKTLDVERLAKIRDVLDMIAEWGAQVDGYMLGLLEQGVSIPGWKLVDKVARRQIAAPPKLITDYMVVTYGLAEDDIMPRKLAGLGEIEKKIKAVVTEKDARKEALDDFTLRFTVKESSGRTMARAGDRRDAVNAIAQDFGSVILDG